MEILDTAQTIMFEHGKISRILPIACPLFFKEKAHKLLAVLASGSWGLLIVGWNLSSKEFDVKLSNSESLMISNQFTRHT